MLVVGLSDLDIETIFNGATRTQRNMGFREMIAGFAPEDKFHLRRLEDYEVELDERRRALQLSMDPGGDVFIGVHESIELPDGRARALDFDVQSVCDQTEKFAKLGLSIIRVNGLYPLVQYGLTRTDLS